MWSHGQEACVPPWRACACRAAFVCGGPAYRARATRRRRALHAHIFPPTAKMLRYAAPAIFMAACVQAQFEDPATADDFDAWVGSAG